MPDCLRLPQSARVQRGASALALLWQLLGQHTARADDDIPATAPAPPPAAIAPAAPDEAVAANPIDAVAANPIDTAASAPNVPLAREGHQGAAENGPSLDERSEGSLRARGEQQHDGFFLRLTAGAGAGTATYREPVSGKDSNVQTRGLTGLLEVAAGYTVIEHLILHGNALVAGFGDARRTVNGIPDASTKPTTTTTMLGAGASYYFPLNVYVTGSVGVAWFDEGRNGQHFRTGTGFGLSVATGKEWWVGRTGEWGLGAALRAVVTTGEAELSGDRTRVHTGHIGVAVSATLN